MAKKAAEPTQRDIGAQKAMTLPVATPEQARGDIARLITAPAFAAARGIQAAEGTQGYGALLDTAELVTALREQANAGDTGHLETMLLSQATALQALFVRLLERGMAQTMMPSFDSFLRLALRAQSQCTRTLEVLANVKNPPVVIARQANIAQQQQVNNNPAVPGPEPSRARNLANAQSKLLEPIPDERLECGTQSTASGADSQLATVGTVNRPEV